MDCPSCREGMAPKTLESRYGRSVDVDLCHGCAAIWFDGFESVTLAPGAVLDLFAAIHDRHGAPRRPLADLLGCPRCRARLARTTDQQRRTVFSYWRCPAEHGRLVTFLDFLREKDFVRPLDAAELAELKTHVRTLTCSSCGGPVDLERDSACAHCRAPIALLDPKQVERVLTQLREAREGRRSIPPDLPLRLLSDEQHVRRVFDGIDAKAGFPHANDSYGLVEGSIASLMSALLTS